jgi:iron complex transport system substrate-binding protein
VTEATDDATRIVSLAPSATAVVSALDAEDQLVGVTAHCDADAPSLGGWLNTDPERVAELDPDLVLTADALQRDLRENLREAGLSVFHVEPETLSAVFDSFSEIGRAVGLPDTGEHLAADCRERVEQVRQRTPDDETERPVVYCEEWHEPPMAAGNWVPEAVAAAGGQYPFVDPGERSSEVSRARVAAAEPDHVVIHHCGHGERADPEVLAARGWDLDATVHVLDDDLLNQPSPRLVDGIETLAGLLHD